MKAIKSYIKFTQGFPYIHLYRISPLPPLPII